MVKPGFEASQFALLYFLPRLVDALGRLVLGARGFLWKLKAMAFRVFKPQRDDHLSKHSFGDCW